MRNSNHYIAKVLFAILFTVILISFASTTVTAAGNCDDAAIRCNDNDACTTDTCDEGTGACGHTAIVCNDSNACTSDACDPLNGCVFTINNTLPCSDKNSCTDGDYCLNGLCKSGVVRNCDDGNICTDDKMIPVIEVCCIHVPNTKSCNDNNACTSNDKCAKAVCAGTSKTCEDYNSCTTNSCDPASGSCVYSPVPDCICAGKPNGSPCTDGNACTVDSCVNQVCVSTARTCNDNNVCTTDTCNTSTGCVFTNNTLSCSDNNTCTVGDVCLNGVCKPGATTNCDDGNICTINTSVPVLPGCCVHGTNTLPCSDNNVCTTGDVCANKVCKGAPVADGTACDDGNVCTENDACSGGVCVAGAPMLCPVGVCDPVSGCPVSTPPTGSIVINNGAAFTNTTNVTLTLSATDSDGSVTEMQFSNDGSTWSTPEPYATSKNWTLTTGDGIKTVFAIFKDNADNWSNAIPSNTIIFDTTPPAVSVNSPADGFTNNKTPLLSYTVSDGAVVVKVDGIIVPKISGSNLDSLTDGAHTVRVASTDAANNLGFAEVSFTVDTLPPLVVGEMPKISKISAGDDHSLAIATDGSLWAWGTNWSGYLGDGTMQPSNSPRKIGADTIWSAISAGYDANLALKSDGTLWAWGANSYGQLGDGTTDDKHAPVQIGLDNNWKSISMKGYHGLALKQDGTLWSWGVNWEGEVGDGTTDDRHFPIQIGSDTNWTAVSAGFWHSLALKSDGTLWAWGANWYGQLGDGTTHDKHAPVQIGIDADWVAVDEGDSGSFALKSNGTLWAWGGNQGGWYGLLGDGTFTDQHAPVQIGIDNNWASIAASGEGEYVLALKTDGTLWAWGSNWNGQLLNGTYYDQYVPIQIDTDNTWSAISAGLYYSVALKPDGTLWTWGYNDQGLLGDGTYQDIYTPHRIDYISVTSNVISINSGANTTNSVSVTLNLNASDMTSGIALMRFSNDGVAWSAPEPYATTRDWTLTAGDGRKTVYVMFQDGAGNWSSVFSASIILDARPPTVAVTSPASGLTYNATPLLSYTVSKGTVIVTVDGAAVNKGSGDQLGPLIDGQHVVRVTATDEFGIAAFTEVTFTVDIAPPLAGTTPKFIEIAAGWDHSLAIAADGSLWAWGANWTGQLGDGMTTVFSSTPEKIGMDSTWSSVFASDYCSLALKSDGTLWAWGLNWYGNLGNGTHNFQSAPAQIGTDNNWKSIATSSYHSAALKQDGTLWAWGANGSGELGDGTIVERLAPVLVAGNVISVAVGAYHTVAVKSDGTLWAWGANEWGQLGDGTALDQHAPFQIGSDKDWISAAAGYYSSYALKSNGTLWAWGGNWSGELGDGTGDGTSDHNKYAPVQVGTESTWSSISANGQGFHVLALKSDGSLWAWGFNGCGQLGDGTIADKNVPIPIATGTLWSSAAASFCHSIALKSDGTIWSWGNNGDGQLGDGTTQDRTMPHYIFDRDVIVINNGDGYTSGTAATLTLNAWDTTSGVAYMQFSADEITWSTPEHYAATKNWTLSEGDGLKTVYVRFQDAAGNWSAPFSASITLDTTSPVVTIISPVAGATNNSMPLLQYTVTDGTVVVKVDGSIVNKISGSLLDMLSDGTHTVRVEATDAAGNAGSAQVSITVDTTPPIVTIASPIAGTTNNRNPMLMYTASEGTVVVKVDGSIVYKVFGDALDSLSDGTHTVRVEATDAAGNAGSAQVSITVDTTSPIVTIASPIVGVTDINRLPLEYAASEGTVVVKVDGAIVNKISGSLLDTLADGTHTVRVEATDAANNIGFAEVAFTVDAVAPTVMITSPAPGATNNKTPALVYTVSDGTVVVKVDGIVANKVSGNTLDTLTDGSHTLRVESTDTHGRTGFAEEVFTVDTITPTVTMTSPVAGFTNTKTQMLTYTASDGTVIVKVDGAAVNKVSGSSLGPLSDGAHTVRVEAVDAAGNIGSAQVTLTIDTTPPAVTIASPVAGTTNLNTLPFIYTVSDGDVVVKVDGSVVNMASGSTLDNLANGSHNVRVEATDAVGNANFAEVTFTVDTASAGNDDTNIYCMGTGTVLVGPSAFTNGISVPSSNNIVLIASPYNGETITGSKTIIKGAMDNTVPVMGVVVQVINSAGTGTYPVVVNGKYFAAQVPLAPDSNIIKVIATDQNNAQHQTSITVTGVIQSNNVNIYAAPTAGIPTLKQNGRTLLNVALNTTTSISNPVKRYAWDFNGSGTSQLTCYSHSNVTASYEHVGLYLANVTVTDTAGSHYTETAIVNVVDAGVMNSTLRAIWNNIKSALANQDIPTALNSFADSAKNIYGYHYQILLDHLPEVSQGMTDITVLKVGDNIAECEMRIIENGSEAAYYVVFTKDNNGIWRLNFY
ncbi:MAG: hypothetical protein M0R70_00295 [Nitrospirae bacterium]|nr:hypothetical protein [Nitrospirota bacterium]